ncbi:HNH endonuclease signature motif containing protein [Pectobacteriaceae bacterium CE90]|nr:HNH endonuclease signature motif containing protein [Pectobacteriaceae bacterium CE90]
MPLATPRACRCRGCRKTTTHKSGYCEDHRSIGWQSYKPGMNRHRRGYGTGWETLRAQVLRRDNYLCVECKKNGIATRASTVDHVLPKSQGGTDAESNLQSLCWPHHRTKTAKERNNNK